MLLFGSGMCALVYQAVWFREFRLIFGASTAANAAVLGLFMGGLGLGSAFLSRRAEKSGRPLALYAKWEIGIAIGAALSPFILFAVQKLYFMTGGIPSIGLVAGTGLRLLLASIVMGVPAFLMGGTLPAAVRAVVSREDVGRRGLSVLYGINALGAVTGVFLSTFVLIELLGNRQTLWLAAVVNLVVALIALRLGRRMPLPDAAGDEAEAEPVAALHKEESMLPAPVVFAAAAVVGFCFFLLELVWYRMLGPVLGGSTFTFGIILMMALLGIGLGGLIHGWLGSGRQATPGAFALTCALEAFFVILPVVLGDRLVVFAGLLQSLHTFGFWGNVMSWAVVTGIVVLPAAFIAGIQFPMLISLLGRGGKSVARQTGEAYAWNTAGAIAGSLTGGFGLLPLLTAPLAWKIVAAILALLAALVAFHDLQRKKAHPLSAGLALGIVVVVVFCFSAQGPTAFWRHSPIGAGRLSLLGKSWNEVRAGQNFTRSAILWEAEGVESCVGLQVSDGFAFVVNGKIDGNAVGDKGTQIMGGILPAILHGDVKRACVVGLGTGSTAGWLGKLPDIERVLAVELEPAMRQIADVCAPVNQDVLRNPKVEIIYNDAREVLTTTREKFDLIMSEPSNPYRAGIASLFTKEYYEACRRILNQDGVFAQWLQAYEVDVRTIRIVYRTLREVFPSVSTYITQTGDLLLVCRNARVPLDLQKLAATASREPYRSAMLQTWKADGTDVILGRHVIGPDFADLVAKSAVDPINTDDRTVLEYAFARTVGDSSRFSVFELSDFARVSGMQRPELTPGSVEPDWNRVDQVAIMSQNSQRGALMYSEDATEQEKFLTDIFAAYQAQNWDLILDAWTNKKWAPVTPVEAIILAEALAAKDHAEFPNWLAIVQKATPHEAIYLEALLATTRGNYPEAVGHLRKFFEIARVSPWCWKPIAARAMITAHAISAIAKDPVLTRQLIETLSVPFIAGMLNFDRNSAAMRIAGHLPPPDGMLLMSYFIHEREPWVPWELDFLKTRVLTYRETENPLSKTAMEDFTSFISREPINIDDGLIK